VYKKRAKWEWGEIFRDLIEIPERYKALSVIEKKELRIYLEDSRSPLIEAIGMRLDGEKKHPLYGTEQHVLFCQNNCYQGVVNLVQIDSWIEYIDADLKPMNNLKEHEIFNPQIGEDFFEYLVENWIKTESYKKTALSYVFRRMWHGDALEDCLYTIGSTSTKFATYWNNNYSHIGLTIDEKNPKFKDYISVKRYKIKFDKLLDKFEIKLTGD
jgi:hypothetical protein